MNAAYEPVIKALSLLAPTDRRWLLSRLDGARRGQLAGMLDAAASGRMPGAAAAPARQNATRKAQVDSDDDMSALIEEIDRMPAEELLALWRGAHTGLLRCFIGIHPWRCADALRPLAGSSGIGELPSDEPVVVRKAVLKAVISAANRNKLGALA